MDKSIRIAIVLMLTAIGQSGHAQYFSLNSLSMTIEQDTLMCHYPCKEAPVSFTVTNNSNENVLVYALDGGPMPSDKDLSRACDTERTGTGIQFTLSRPDGKYKIVTSVDIDDFSRPPVTKQQVDSALLEMKIYFMKGATILKAHEKKTFSTFLPVKDYKLGKGTFYLEMVYYCGKYTVNDLGSTELAKFDAKLFQGCAASEKIPFIVN